MHSARQEVPEPGYQPGDQAWDPRRPDLPDLLRRASHADCYPIYRGSNHTFLVIVDAEEHGQSLAVYKPARGEYPLYDFAGGTLYRREIGAYLLDKILGWSVVPPTVVTSGRHGEGSLQVYIESPDEAEVEVTELRRMAALDVLLNNADRKADHCLPGLDGSLWGIDHGLTFHTQPKLRTVLWHFAGSALTAVESADLARALTSLQHMVGDEAGELRELISTSEFRALVSRVDWLLESGEFPNPGYKAVPYRW